MYKPGLYCSGGEVDKCRDRLSQFCVGDGLDIGCGGTNCDNRFYSENKIIPSAIGIDLGKTNLTGPAHNLKWFQDSCMDFIFSSHLLEHLPKPGQVLSEWFRVLKDGGYLVMYLPLEGYYPSVGTPGANKDHKHNLHPQKVLEWLNEESTSFEIVKVELRTGGDEYSFDFVVKKVNSCIGNCCLS